MYFCKNCGEPYMTDEAVMCVKCGVAKGQGNNYCHNCGKPLAPDAAVCLNCGVANKQAPAPDAKSKLVAGLLAIFLGTFGVHNFYLGYTGKAVTQLVLSIVGILLCCVVVGVFIVMGVGIWGLVEGILILTGKIDTGDLFVGDSETKAAIEAKCAPDCVEMEGAAVSQIAAKNGVPCVILRAMSDNADEDGHEVLVVKKFSIGEYVATATKIVAAMVEKL